MDLFKRHDYFFVLLISCFICISFSGTYPIYILDEARNSEAAREMLVSGNYVVPTFNGQLRTDKPPLHYFFMALGYKLFGTGAFGARFFSGVFGALTVLATYWNVKRHKNRILAMITVFILLSSLLFVQEFHLAVPDPYLIFFISFSLFSFFNFYRFNSIWWFFATYISIGLGFLTKGPVALVLPGLVVPTFLLFKSEFNLKSIRRLKPVMGLLFVALIALPWYHMVHVETNGEWTKGFFLDHNISRFGSEKEGHGGLFITTLLFVVLGLLPFSVFGVQGFILGWKARRTDDFHFFSFLVATVTLLFFSMASTKLPNYPMPCYPFIAILIAFYFYKLVKERFRSRSVYWSLGLLVLVSVALPLGGYIALGIEEQFSQMKSVALWLSLLTISGILGFHFYYKNYLKRSFFAISLGWILTGFCLFGIVYPALTSQSPVSLAGNIVPKDATVVVFKRFDSAFPINFKRTFQVFDSIKELEVYLESAPTSYIITNTRNKEDLKQLEKFDLILEQKALFENNTTRIYKK